ncbi:MAG: hypothetical protein HKN45_04175 [Flavobacteriales bacterium]|nr:hypothetical protein [Flavobacteriales bacterium]
MKGLKFILMAAVLSCTACSSKPEAEKTKQDEATAMEKGVKPYVEVYDSGQPKIKGAMVDGERDGLWVSFYENGVRWSEENYMKGVREGRVINFYPNGIIRYRGQYIDDKKAGLWQFYDEEGKLIREENFEY